ncbi:hypothetical protein Scep_010808 [Stephania cephalantha]|uniref:Uncharacterized protein n=1 Tax=Stephania cephalantha TaxID=152367 RepID=A0AAP0PEJ9_9MAGN
MSKKASASASASTNRFKPLCTPEPNCSYLATTQHLICILEPSVINKPLTTQIACTMPPGLHFIPTRPQATIQFYENILIATQSVHFEHMSREKSIEIDYSKFKIQRVLSADEWCENYKFLATTPFTYKDIVISKNSPAVSLSYHDYIEAWRQIMFYQDPDHHSWYISFRQNCQTSFPLWWVTSWWTKFGPHEAIFPARVQEQFVKEKLPLLQFIIKFSIPWILKWDYGTSDLFAYTPQTTYKYLTQNISCKWWNKFNYEAIFAPKTPIKLQALSSRYADVVAKTASASIDPNMTKILAKIQQLEDDNKQMRIALEQVSSRCSPTPSSVHLSDDDTR